MGTGGAGGDWGAEGLRGLRGLGGGADGTGGYWRHWDFKTNLGYTGSSRPTKATHYMKSSLKPTKQKNIQI